MLRERQGWNRQDLLRARAIDECHRSCVHIQVNDLVGTRNEEFRAVLTVAPQRDEISARRLHRLILDGRRGGVQPRTRYVLREHEVATSDPPGLPTYAPRSFTRYGDDAEAALKAWNSAGSVTTFAEFTRPHTTGGWRASDLRKWGITLSDPVTYPDGTLYHLSIPTGAAGLGMPAGG